MPEASASVRSSTGLAPLNTPHGLSQPGTTQAWLIHPLDPSALNPPMARHCSAVVVESPITPAPGLVQSPTWRWKWSFAPVKPWLGSASPAWIM